MLALWWSAIAVLAPWALAAPYLVYDVNTLSPYFTFTDGAEPWRVYRRSMGAGLSPPEILAEQNTWFGLGQNWWYKNTSPGASFSFNMTGRTTIRGYLNTTLSTDQLLSNNVMSITINGQSAPINATTDGFRPTVYIRDDSFLEVSSPGGVSAVTVTLGPAFQGEIAVGYLTSWVYPPALDSSLSQFPAVTKERYHSHSFSTINRTTWVWEGEWGVSVQPLVLSMANDTRDWGFAHGKKGAKVSGRVPDNTTIFTVWGMINKDTGVMVTMDPAPPSTASPNPFMAVTNKSYGPAGALFYLTQLDPAVQYTVTVEALTDQGCYIDYAEAYPYDMTRVNDPTWWPAFYTGENATSSQAGTSASPASTRTSGQAGADVGGATTQGSASTGAEKKGPTTGAIAGAIVASLAGVALIAGLLVFCLLRRKRQQPTKNIPRRIDDLEDKHELVPYDLVSSPSYSSSYPDLGGATPETTAPTPFPMPLTSSSSYRGLMDPSTAGFKDPSPFGGRSYGQPHPIPMSTGVANSDYSSHRLPDDGTLLVAVREVLSQHLAAQRPNTPGTGAGFDEALILQAVRQALAESGSGLTSRDSPVSEHGRSPFVGPDESTMVASLKSGHGSLASSPTSSRPSPTSSTPFTADNALADAAARNRAAGSMAQTVQTEEKALLMAIKDVVGQANSGGERRPPRAPRGALRVRHDEDGGALAVAPAMPREREEVLPPMYNPQWENQRRERQEEADGAQ